MTLHEDLARIMRRAEKRQPQLEALDREFAEDCRAARSRQLQEAANALEAAGVSPCKDGDYKAHTSKGAEMVLPTEDDWVQIPGLNARVREVPE